MRHGTLLVVHSVAVDSWLLACLPHGISAGGSYASGWHVLVLSVPTCVVSAHNVAVLLILQHAFVTDVGDGRQLLALVLPHPVALVRGRLLRVLIAHGVVRVADGVLRACLRLVLFVWIVALADVHAVRLRLHSLVVTLRLPLGVSMPAIPVVPRVIIGGHIPVLRVSLHVSRATLVVGWHSSSRGQLA